MQGLPGKRSPLEPCSLLLACLRLHLLHVGLHRVLTRLGLGRVRRVLELAGTLLIATADEQARRAQRHDRTEERQAREQEPPAGPMSLTRMIHVKFLKV